MLPIVGEFGYLPFEPNAAHLLFVAYREMALSFDTEDFREGVAHFVEKLRRGWLRDS